MSMRFHPSCTLNPLPRGPLKDTSAPGFSLCSSELTFPTLATEMVSGSLFAMDIGLSPTPGTQTMRNWPGSQTRRVSNSMVFTLLLSDVTLPTLAVCMGILSWNVSLMGNTDQVVYLLVSALLHPGAHLALYLHEGVSAPEIHRAAHPDERGAGH